MTFLRFTLHHVGIYQGRHTFELEPQPGRPLIVFMGLNGSGKTTFFQALQLVLFGRHCLPFKHEAERAGTSYDDFLFELVNHHTSPEEGASLELEFDAVREGRPHRFRLQRSWRRVDKKSRVSLPSAATPNGRAQSALADGWTMRETVEVFCGDVRDGDLSSHWDDGAVDEFLPRALAPLFFFDGEKLREWSDMLDSGELLSASMQSLLGLDVLDRTLADLTALEKKQRASAAPSEEVAALEKLQSAVTEARVRLDACQTQLSNALKELDRRQGELRQREMESEARGSSLIARRPELEAKLEAAEARLARLKSEQASVKIQADRLRKAWTAFRALAEQRDAALLEAAPEKLRPALAKLIAAQPISTLDPSLVLLQEDEKKLKGANAMSSAKVIDAEIKELRAMLERIPDGQELAPVEERLAAARSELERTRLRVDGLKAEENRATLAVAEAEAAVQRRQEVLARELRAHHQAVRALRLTTTARDKFSAFRQGLVQRQTEALSQRLTENYARLLHKERGLVDQVRISHESGPGNAQRWSMALEHQGQLRQASRFSMGEQQLLALALIWSLAQVSGYKAPFVIDTPLARLDSAHRGSVGETFLPHAASQVIVFSTDEEQIVGSHRAATVSSLEVRIEEEAKL